MAPLDLTPDWPRRTAQWIPVTSVMDEAASWSRSARDRVQALARLEENWNTYGSPAISPEAVSEALKLLTDIARLGMPEPKIVPVSGGGLQMEWANGRSEIEIEIFPDKSIQYLLVDAEGKMLEGQIFRREDAAEFAPLTSWYLKEIPSIEPLIRAYGKSC